MHHDWIQVLVGVIGVLTLSIIISLFIVGFLFMFIYGLWLTFG